MAMGSRILSERENLPEAVGVHVTKKKKLRSMLV